MSLRNLSTEALWSRGPGISVGEKYAYKIVGESRLLGEGVVW